MTSRIRLSEAEMFRDSLARAVYSCLFDFIVSTLNSRIEPPSGFQEFLGETIVNYSRTQVVERDFSHCFQEGALCLYGCLHEHLNCLVIFEYPAK